MIRYLRSTEGVVLAIATCVALGLFVVPLGLLAQVGVTDDGGLGLAPLVEAFDSRSVRRAFWNSLDSSLFSAALAVIAGTGAAMILITWLTTRPLRI